MAHGQVGSYGPRCGSQTRNRRSKRGMLSFRKPCKGVPAGGHTGAAAQASPEKAQAHQGHLCRPLREKQAGWGPHLEAPCPEGSQGAVCLGPGLTSLGERFLISAASGLGLHLGSTGRETSQLWQRVWRARGPGSLLGRVGWTGV